MPVQSSEMKVFYVVRMLFPRDLVVVLESVRYSDAFLVFATSSRRAWQSGENPFLNRI